MNMKIISRILIITLLLCHINSYGQIQTAPEASGAISTQYMMRTEYRHGYQALADTNQTPGIFTSQRARIGYQYNTNKFRVSATIQDVRVWGATNNLSIDTMGTLSLYEGWGELIFTPKLSLKAGRQALSYDDDRILGTLDWSMQGRRHDLGLLKYVNDSVLTVHAGIAYNQDKDQSKSNIYYQKNNYKSMQYLWVFRQFKNINISALFLNNGLQYIQKNTAGKTINEKQYYSQTAGVRSQMKFGKVSTIAYFYYQTGKNMATPKSDGLPKDLAAYNASVEISYWPVKAMGVTIGGEILSGNSQDATTTQTKTSAFTPLYGTNHRFNGYMDYFYVLNHANSVGLNDIYLKLNTVYKKYSASLNSHYFMANADIKDDKKTLSKGVFVAMPDYLGVELDMTLSYNFTEGIGIQGGYSQLFGTESLTAIRGGNLNESSNWAYLMILIRPGVKWPKTGIKA
ncbi:MAG: hypothetical protein IT223_07165 [Crocinitomicaceae bacterium]|nr:hypothetical protein [Crocinitomicaceae bacterium]